MTKCPICEAEAKDITVKTFDGRTFSCSACGDFDVSGTVYESGMLATKTLPERSAALDRAKARVTPGSRPMIISHDF